MPLYSTDDFQTSWAYLVHTSVTLWEVTAPVKLPTLHCLVSRLAWNNEDVVWQQDWCFIDSLRWACAQRSLLTIYTVQLTKSTSIQGCSKGARGLSVLPQVPRIFTGISISLSLCWRQRGSRYAIHAGRNLPDKEFRYLWTVIVTAAVYMVFHPKCYSHLNFTCQHRAGVRLYTSSYDFAESCVFDKQSLPPFLLYLTLVTQSRLCFSRSYTYNLPSSFSTIISYTLVYSTRSPVSVYGTVYIYKLFLVNDKRMPNQSK